MSMNQTELSQIVKELDDLIGQPVTGVWQPTRDRFILGIGGCFLLMVPRGPFARLHPILQRPRNHSHPFSFQGACRAHLQGPLTALHPSLDRVLTLQFGKSSLHLRLTGRSGGLWLLDGDRTLAAIDGPAPPSLPPLPEFVPQNRLSRFSPEPGQSWGSAAESWFEAAEQQWRLEQARKSAIQRLERSIERTERLLTALNDDLETAAQAPFLRRKADTLAAHLHQVKRGQRSISLSDLEDPSVVHTFEFASNKPPSSTLERLYHRVGRLDRAADRVLSNLDVNERKLADLRDILIRVRTLPHHEWSHLLPSLPPETSGAPTLHRPWAEWCGPNGEKVLVGRNESANRKLTFQIAKGRDYWMHVRGQPGAHLLLPMKEGQTPTLEHLLAAAQIALLQGKLSEAEVQYTRARNVRSIPGTVASVSVHEEKVLRVHRDDSGLAGWRRAEDP